MACHKITFENRDEAYRMNKILGHQCIVYKCEYCGGWHRGRDYDPYIGQRPPRKGKKKKHRRDGKKVRSLLKRKAWSY